MVFITAGMGGGTGTGAAPVIARAARERGILTVGVVTKPFQFEGNHRMKLADTGIEELTQYVDTLIIIPNQNLFRVANEKTTFADAFNMADDVLHSGVRGVTDLMIMPGMINLDFADIRTVMSEMGKAMMGTGEASGDKRAIDAAEAAINNPLLDDTTMKGAKGVLINITGGYDMSLFEVDEAANRIREEVDPEANIIFGTSLDDKMDGVMRVSVVATGIANEGLAAAPRPMPLPERTLARSSTPQIASEELEATETLALASPMSSEQAPAATATATVEAEAPKEEAVDVKAGQEALQLTMAEADKAEAPAEENTHDISTHEAVAEAREAAETSSSTLAAATTASTAPVTETKPFIAPAPELPKEVPSASIKQPDPISESDMINAGPKPEPARQKARSLFHEITGLGRKKAEGAAPTVVSEAPKPVPTVAAAPAAKPVQPKLGALDPNDRVRPSQSEEEMLEIPAFLRRQAN
jgi:cell division protein FtsZ